jgi:coproporphyrinogen III oxidase-like Fe-S oxidoreductase
MAIVGPRRNFPLLTTEALESSRSNHGGVFLKYELYILPTVSIKLSIRPILLQDPWEESLPGLRKIYFLFPVLCSVMAGIYLHIPFCKQACHYCDFHFTTSQRGREDMFTAMVEEVKMRAAELSEEEVGTIYFGGGTPSLLSYEELMSFFDVIYTLYKVNPSAEVTIEANPDDLTPAFLKQLKQTPVNRLSIGIQSFREEDLQRMNRAHNAGMAMRCVPDAVDAGFDNISIDLIFGLPYLEMEHWQENVEPLEKLIQKFQSRIAPEDKYFFKEFVLWGLVEYKKLSKNRFMEGFQFSDLFTR